MPREYTRKKKRATVKRRKKLAPKKRRRITRKPVEAKRPAVKKAAVKKAPRKPVARKKAARKPVARRKVPRKPAAGKKASRKPVAGKKASRKPAAPRPRGVKATRRAKKQRELVERRLTKLEKDRQRARRKRPPKGKQKPPGIARRKREIEAQRLAEKIAAEQAKAPRGKKPSKRKTRAEIAERMRERFSDLLEIGRQTNQTPAVDYRRRRMRSDRNVGEMRVIKIEMLVEPETVEEILWRVGRAVSTMSGTFTIWLAIAAFAAMGERLVGYGNRVLKANDEDAAQFQMQGIETTGVVSSSTRMLAGLRDLFEEFAAETHTVIHCFFVKVMNFNRRG